VSELTHDDVQTILKIINEMGDRDVHLEIGELKVQVTRQGHGAPAVAGPAVPPPAPATVVAVPPVAAKTSEVPSGEVAIRAPTSGTFYRAGSPGAAPYVEVGTHVAADDIVCVFEVMKLFTSLRAGVAGVVSSILVANEAPVEQDQLLILITPD
jgi:acetyl-CoA carboxylase biotin carboxyl carrier protein